VASVKNISALQARSQTMSKAAPNLEHWSK